MLDPELIDELAAQPEKNAPAVNRALAEEGHGTVLLALARSGATAGDALAVAARRMVEQGARLNPPPDEDGEAPAIDVPGELERLLVAHPNSPDDVRDLIVDSHPNDPFFVLAGASHPRATVRAVERAATWPSGYDVYDRRWLQLIPETAITPLMAEEWAQDPSPLLRETIARLTDHQELLAALSSDPSRRVRRAVASNLHASEQRARLATEDPAPEVRARAAGEISAHGTTSIGVASASFAAALRAMESGGVLAPDVAEALSSAESLDEEGALLAAQVLEPRPVVTLIRETTGAGRHALAHALAAGLALRCPDEEEAFRDLVAEATKALSESGVDAGNLTGKARLAAWLGDGLAGCGVLDPEELLVAMPRDALGAEVPVLARGATLAPRLLTCMCAQIERTRELPPALLELAWRSESVSDELVAAMAARVGKAKRRGQDLPEDEIDLDPRRRSLDVLEKVVLAISRKVVLSPRTALPVVALDSRRVRYVLTALPSWRGSLRGSMLGRVLRQRAGALSAARSETRSRAAELRDWTQRMMSDTEVGVAMAVGHFTADALVHRIEQGRHSPDDGASIAAGAETRAVLEGAESVRSLLRWSAKHRGQLGAALAMWLLLEDLDRTRPAGQIASGLDTIAQRSKNVSATVADALAILERRQPGRLERVFPQTPRGRATLASGIARAYRALGGLRDER